MTHLFLAVISHSVILWQCRQGLKIQVNPCTQLAEDSVAFGQNVAIVLSRRVGVGNSLEKDLCGRTGCK